MFDKISEKRFQHLASDFVKLRDKVTETPGEVRRLRQRVEELENANVKYGIESRRIMNNLIEVIRAISKPADLKKVIATGDDDTEISVEDVLNAKGLIPECELEKAPVEEEREPVSDEYPRARYMEESDDETESDASTTSNYY